MGKRLELVLVGLTFGSYPVPSTLAFLSDSHLSTEEAAGGEGCQDFSDRLRVACFSGDGLEALKEK